MKSQLATVSRSLAALTMASGIMLNAAPRLLSPIDRHQRRPSEHTGKGRRTLNEDVTAITQARLTDALLCLLFLLLPRPPFPSPHIFFLKFFFDSLFEVQLHLSQLFHNACPLFEFA